MKSAVDWENSDFQAGSIPNEWKEKMKTLLIPGSVLDIGCGTGRFTKMFLDRKYTGVDISHKSIKVAKRLFPKTEFIQADITCWKGWKKYDNIFSWVSLQHIHPEEIKNVFENIKKHGNNFVFCENLDDVNSNYQWKHDYDKYFNLIYSESLNGPVTLMRLK